MGFGVVRPVGKSLIGALARPTRLAGHRLNAIDQREELSDVMNIAAIPAPAKSPEESQDFAGRFRNCG